LIGPTTHSRDDGTEEEQSNLRRCAKIYPFLITWKKRGCKYQPPWLFPSLFPSPLPSPLPPALPLHWTMHTGLCTLDYAHWTILLHSLLILLHSLLILLHALLHAVGAGCWLPASGWQAAGEEDESDYNACPTRLRQVCRWMGDCKQLAKPPPAPSLRSQKGKHEWRGGGGGGRGAGPPPAPATSRAGCLSAGQTVVLIIYPVYIASDLASK
jgi:hypothetical protein